MMTLDDLEKIEKEYLIPTQVAPILGCAAYNINVQVKEDKKNGTNSFPFPTILIGTRIRIPKMAFIEVMRHGTAN